MTEFNEMLNLLEAERERYVLEAASLERRLESVHNQINAIDNLISGYIKEKQHHQFYQLFSQSHTQAYLEEDRPNIDILSVDENIEDKPNLDIEVEEKTDEEKLNQAENHNKAKPQPKKADTSNVQKVKGGRQSESLPMLRQYQGYSIRNAILILMRAQPEKHFHINIIVRNLYGEDLTKKQYQTARVSVTKALSLGFKSGLWFKVLRPPGVYTLKYEKGVTAKTPKD
ncbi:hypothetical protein NIES267_67710 [Calothrix parasitica NIES-267]|uniref:Uncharacterized protein n=1 Tax=Calothrix parasitica NIES-267 TaxID=1973488 RepID=A0A1Z4M197_9CYAN|nr:hypothetical protein NIES267_67710 [Calothrix parasitica NIES-267]